MYGFDHGKNVFDWSASLNIVTGAGNVAAACAEGVQTRVNFPADLFGRSTGEN